MDVSDFLVEYDLTPEQRALAEHLKAEASLRQMLHALADHALHYSQEIAAARRRAAGPPGGDGGLRARVLAWFSSLGGPQRVSLLTCDDPGWVRTALQMMRLCGAADPAECRLAVAARPAGAAARAAGGRPEPSAQQQRAQRARAAGAAAAAGAVGAISAPKAAGSRDPGVHVRRPYRMPDGEVLRPPQTAAHLAASRALAAGLRVVLGGCCASPVTYELGALVPTPSLIADPVAFVAMMDDVSLGRFLRDARPEPPRPGPAGLAEAPWLRQWGSHFPFAAFLASRLEVLLVQGFASRGAAPRAPPAVLGLAEVWAAMPLERRQEVMAGLGRRLLRRLLSAALAAAGGGRGAGGPAPGWKPPRCLAALVAGAAGRGPRRRPPAATGWPAAAPCSPGPHGGGALLGEMAGLATTVPLTLAVCLPGTPMEVLVLENPGMWLHQQLAYEFATECSESQAVALLERSGAAQDGPRSSKRQRQKLRRRLAAEEAAAAEEPQRQARPPSQEAPTVGAEAGPALPIARERVPPGESATELLSADPPEEHRAELRSGDGDALHPVGRGGLDQLQPREGSLDPRTPHHAFSPAVLSETPGSVHDDCDALTEISSATGLRTSRSNSVAGGYGVSSLSRTHLKHMAMLERSYWDAELRNARRRGRSGGAWHDDSRLEFLLRSRDRFAAEVEWDRTSQCSVPASLDEGSLYPVGLESRFAHLFDSPLRSQRTTPLPSEASRADDVERLRAQWEDTFDEMHSLTKALERTETEREMWKAKAEELEARQERESRIARARQPLAAQGVAERLPGADDAGCHSPRLERLPPAAPAVGGPRPPALVARVRRGSGSGDPPGCGDLLSSAERGWNYLALLVLARDEAAEAPPEPQPRASTEPEPHASAHAPARRSRSSCSSSASAAAEAVSFLENPHMDAVPQRSVSMPGLGAATLEMFTPQVEGAVVPPAAARGALAAPPRGEREASASPEPQASADTASEGRDACSPPPPQGRAQASKRALHVTFGPRYKRPICDVATQTAPAITLSRMYGDMVPRYVQGELARLRQENHTLRAENQILRYQILRHGRIGRPRPVRHQATQTAPAITQTFQPARQAAGGGLASGHAAREPRSSPSLPRGLPPVERAVYPLAAEPSWLPDKLALDESIHAFVGAVEAQTQGQEVYRRVVRALCQRAAQTLWPRSSAELYGSFASGLALPSSGLDLVVNLDASGAEVPHGPRRLQTISEFNENDPSRLERFPLAGDAPGHAAAPPSWQSKLSERLAHEKWVLSDSIRITAHAAIPVLSFITAPEEAASELAEAEESTRWPIRVDITLEGPHHRGPHHTGLRSKAIVSWLLDEYEHARSVTLVLKQWLIERTYGTSHTGGLCSYGLLLMVVGFLQLYPADSAATALVGVLNFYGRVFDPQLYGVSVARGALLHRKSPAAWPPAQARYVESGFCPGASEFDALSHGSMLTREDAHRFDPLWVEDPLNPANNVGRNCFRIRQIQRSFAHAHDALKSGEAGSQLDAILLSEGEGGGPAAGLEAEQGRLCQVLHAEQALHEDLRQSLAAHAPELMLPLPARAQVARSHFSQQWDSVARYFARPTASRRPC